MPDEYYNSIFPGEEIDAILGGAVRGDVAQTEDAAWKTQARQNIGAADAQAVGDAINAVIKAYIVSKVVFESFTANGMTFERISDSVVKIYGSNTAGSVRNFTLLNEQNKTLYSSTLVNQVFPAGNYKVIYSLSGYNTTSSTMSHTKTTVTNGTLITSGQIFEEDGPWNCTFRCPKDVNFGTVNDPTYLTVQVIAISAVDAPYVLRSTNDGTDRTSDIRSTLLSYGKCVLSNGVFFASNIEMPGNSALIGNGINSILSMASAATGELLKVNSGCQVMNLTIDGGGGASTPTTVGGRSGIGYTVAASSEISIANCVIAGFDFAGIRCNNTGGAVSSLAISNSFIKYCFYGIYTTDSEYICAVNCQFVKNYFGALNRGGNNKFANCGFDGNLINCQIDNDAGSNGGHGSLVGCSFNHSNLNSNDGYALIVKGAGRMLVSGCNFYYGKLRLENTNGNVISGCGFGNAAGIEIVAGQCSMLVGCMFKSESDSPVTKTENTTAVFANCYTRAGAVFNPI